MVHCVLVIAGRVEVTIREPHTNARRWPFPPPSHPFPSPSLICHFPLEVLPFNPDVSGIAL